MSVAFDMFFITLFLCGCKINILILVFFFTHFEFWFIYAIFIYQCMCLFLKLEIIVINIYTDMKENELLDPLIKRTTLYYGNGSYVHANRIMKGKATIKCLICISQQYKYTVNCRKCGLKKSNIISVLLRKLCHI